MSAKRSCTHVWMLFWLLEAAAPNPEPAAGAATLNHIANISYAAENDKLSAVASIFSPRMDFDQWKPLTGRGDPLLNDPTYDYEPPVLERVHYWADDARLEREHYPERKSEVLMLGVSSRKPSVGPRQPPRRHPRPSLQNKYEDFTYKINDRYPMTILVPPPPPPPGHKPPLYVLTENKMPMHNSQIKITDPPTFVTRQTTPAPEHLTSLYALQEANLIYQSSTTSQNWLINLNQTKPVPNTVSSDYVGWGPTTPLDDSGVVNETHNLIFNDYKELPKHPYTFYKSMLSEAPPPPQPTPTSIFLPTFVPTALPPTEIPTGVTQETQHVTETTAEVFFENFNNQETTTVNAVTDKLVVPTELPPTSKPENTIFDMLSPMMSMPLVNGPERPEDNLYAHASENLQVYKEKPTEDSITLETMQTMQPPPPTTVVESTEEPHPYHTNPHVINNMVHRKPSAFTHDPYLHMRFTTVSPTTEPSNKFKSTTEEPSLPMYLIIQGHSKVKTYSSKPNLSDDRDTISNEIPKHKETTEVKHLHPIKEKKPDNANVIRESRSKNLKSLVDENLGSIEIQETDLGIKYDVSDGSKVPVEIYRRGIVDSDENDYTSAKKHKKDTRSRRQIDLEDLLPFDEDTIEEYVYNFLNGKKNSTGITGLIAQAVTSDAAAVVDELEDDDEENENEDER